MCTWLGAVLAGNAACTLLDDTFEPSELVAADAAVAEASEAAELTPGAPPPEPANEPEERCPAASNQSRDGVDVACLVGVDRQPDAAVVAIDVDAGSSLAEAEPPPPALALPPCAAGFGAFAAPERVTGIDLDGAMYGPSLSADGRTLYFSVAVGRVEQLHSARRAELGAAFEGALELAAVNSDALDGSPFPSRDERRLYFFSERAGVGARDVWVAERASGEEPFSEPQLLGGVNAGGDDFLPWLSPDELVLFFASERQGTLGGTDIWRAARASIADEFEGITNVSELNSNANEGRVALSSDGRRVYFTSDRAGGGGAHDIWTAQRASLDAPFGAVVNVGELNSSGAEIDVFLAADERELFFASTRDGESALWRSVRACNEAEL